MEPNYKMFMLFQCTIFVWPQRHLNIIGQIGGNDYQVCEVRRLCWPSNAWLKLELHYQSKLSGAYLNHIKLKKCNYTYNALGVVPSVTKGLKLIDSILHHGDITPWLEPHNVLSSSQPIILKSAQHSFVLMMICTVIFKHGPMIYCRHPVYCGWGGCMSRCSG